MDINCCRFYPSGMVLLSGGMDMTVRIWSVETGECPRVLKGHKARMCVNFLFIRVFQKFLIWNLSVKARKFCRQLVTGPLKSGIADQENVFQL